MKRLLRFTLVALLLRLCRSRLVARVLFGVRFPPVGGRHYYFDTTAYVLTRFLRRRIKPSNRVLDMGTGSAALMSLYLWRHVNCQVMAADINPVMVEMASAAIRYNDAPVRVIHSDLFSRVDFPFDVVVFNPPYVPTQRGESFEMAQETRSQWDGGPEGVSVIARFLEQFEALDRAVTAYLGINSSYVDDAAMRRQIALRPGVALEHVYRHPLLTTRIYVVATRGTAVD